MNNETKRYNKQTSQTSFSQQQIERTVKKQPHSTEIEEALICCLFKDTSLIGVARSEGINTYSFYSVKCQKLWGAFISCIERNVTVDEFSIGDTLNESGELDLIGGYGYISEIEGKVDTPAGFQHYTKRLKTLESQRYALRVSKDIEEKILGGLFDSSDDLTKFLYESADKISRITTNSSSLDPGKSIVDFERPKNDDETSLIGTNRYLCKGGSLILVGPSGVGKSSSIIQACSQWSLGRDFMGIKSKKKIKFLMIQAEDDDGDIGEVWQSIRESMNYSKEELETIRENLIVVKDKVNSADKFLAVLPEYIRRHKPDIVVINPLMSYIGGDVSKQEVASAFLRNGLNRINKDESVAWIIVHHTTKPPSEKSSQKNENEYMYNMAGSAELINWARAIICLESTKNEGVFRMRLAKRGKRAGVRVNKSSNPIYPEWETVTKIFMKHSKRSIKIDDEFIPLIKWELAEKSEIPDSSDSEKSSSRPVNVDTNELVKCVPIGIKKAASARVIMRTHAEIVGSDKPMSDITWKKKKKEMLDRKLIKEDKLGKIYREEFESIEI